MGKILSSINDTLLEDLDCVNGTASSTASEDARPSSSSTTASIDVPPKEAIAHHLIKAWLHEHGHI